MTVQCREYKAFRFYNSEEKKGAIIETAPVDITHEQFGRSFPEGIWHYIFTFHIHNDIIGNGILHSLVSEMSSWADDNNIHIIAPTKGFFDDNKNYIQQRVLSRFNFTPHGEKFLVRYSSGS